MVRSSLPYETEIVINENTQIKQRTIFQIAKIYVKKIVKDSLPKSTSHIFGLSISVKL